jgi:hypothetical protein
MLQAVKGKLEKSISLEKGKVIMRCSKCGYISFDHLDSCRKCHKPMTNAQLKGTTYSAVAPLFLQDVPETDVSEFVEEVLDVLDPDLDLLAVEDDVEIDFEEHGVEDQDIVMRDEPLSSGSGEISLGDDFDLSFGADSAGPDLSFDEEDLSLDASRFEDVQVKVQPEQSVQPVQFEIPEGLADISDLARPASGAEVKSSLDADIDFGDLDLDELDLSLNGQEGGGADSAREDGLAELSLDDLDLSGALETAPSPQAPVPPVDDDLDFDFDLGGVGEEADAARKKESDDFPDLNLSLD